MKEIKNIISAYDAIDKEHVSCALATVVNVEASSYRRIGARMLVQSTGIWTGGISGGCLEGDALKRSQKAIFKNEVSRVVYDTMEDDANQIGVGLGCNGRIEVLFVPIDFEDPSNPIETLRDILQKDKAQILVQIIDAEKDLQIGKSIAAASLEHAPDFCQIETAQLKELVHETRLLQRPQVVELKNKDDQEVKVLVEFIRPATRIIIIGDNYDVRSMVNFCQELSWKITIVGRVKKLSKDIFVKAEKILEFEDIEQIKTDEYTAVVFMTHDYNWDKKLIPHVFNRELPYIGMLGPRKRLEKLDQEIDEFNLLHTIHLYSPIGLDIGAETPEEIALSVCSEIIAVFRQRSGMHLKHREGPIHDRVS